MPQPGAGPPDAADTVEVEAPAVTARRGNHLAALGEGAVAGVLVALSVPPFGWWALGWVGLGLLAWTLLGRTVRGRVAAGAGYGVTSYLIGLFWVHEFSVPGYVAVTIISTLYAVIATALVPSRRLWEVTASFPAVLVLADAARDRFPLGGLPLASVSLGQADGPLAAVCRIGGSLLVTAAAGLVAVALVGAAKLLRLPMRRDRAVVAAPATAVLALAALLVAGVVWTGGDGRPESSVRVALVQGGGPRGTRAVRTNPQVVFDRHLAASAVLQPPLDLVVLPEGILQSATDFRLTGDAAALGALARYTGASVMSGVEQDVGPTHYLNEVVVWSPDGSVEGSYVKRHLVPFGEYVPFRSFFSALFNLQDVPYDGVPGRRPGFLRTSAGPLGVMISYEVFFDGMARDAVRAGGQLLVVPTNTASYRSSQVPTQEVAADRLRAMETGRWLVQVTPTGFSDVVSPDGRVVRRSRLGARQVIEATVARRGGSTVFDRWGEAPVLAGAGLLWAAPALPPVLRSARRRRLRESAPPGSA